MIKRILLDLDNVLNTFSPFILSSLGCPIGERDYSAYPRVVGYDLVGAANHLLGKFKYTKTSFWKKVTREHWATIPRSDECDFLLEESARLVGEKNVYILTATTIDPDCCAGKLEWIQRFLPRWLHRQYMLSPCKEVPARPDYLLIDDDPNNVNKFRNEGGRAILVPRPWNCLSQLDTFKHLQSALPSWQQEQAVYPAQKSR